MAPRPEPVSGSDSALCGNAFRRFVLLENVVNLLCKPMRPLMTHLLQECNFRSHVLAVSSCIAFQQCAFLKHSSARSLLPEAGWCTGSQWRASKLACRLGASVCRWYISQSRGCPGMHEVKRERVFLLATRRGFTFPAPRSEFWRVVPAQVSRKFECHECLVIAAQDTQVMPKDAMMDAANLTWNERGFLPLRQWLCFSRSASDDQRLKCLGNIVIPRCAQLGLHQLVHELQGAHRS